MAAVEQRADQSDSPANEPAVRGSPRVRLLASAVAGAGLAYGLAHLLGVPQVPGFAGSLLAQPAAGVAVAAVVAAALAAAAAGTALAGAAVHADAGVFAAAVALATFAVRGGPVGPILRQAGPDAYRLMLPELAMLAAILVVAWLASRRIAAGRHGHANDALNAASDSPAPLGQGLLALAVQAVVTALLLWLLARSPVKKQALASLAVAGFAASLAAHHLVPAARGSAWFWGGPLLAGLAGYAWALSNPGHPLLGVPANPLANAVPLDYASLGVAGSLVGYRLSRRWHHERDPAGADCRAGA